MSSNPESGAGEGRVTRKMKGLAVSRGRAAAPVFLFHSSVYENVPEYQVRPDQVEREVRRVEHALAMTHTQLHALGDELRARASGNAVTILDGHQMILDDPSLTAATRELIVKEHVNAEAAVKAIAEKHIAIFAAMDDEYLRDRAQDLMDVSKRIIRNLQGGVDVQMARIREPCILVADELSPSETISLPQNLILGFATDRGNSTSHASLLARALGIPAVVGLGSLSAVARTGDMLLLDGTKGSVTLNPDAAEKEAFEALMAQSSSFAEALEQCKSRPCQTRDGVAVTCMGNVDQKTPMSALHEVGAAGVGLYRSEYLWLAAGREPSEEEQTQAYTAAARAITADQKVVVRVLDIGGDKMVNDAALQKEANPFLGNRSIRYLLRNREVFRRQLRAILRASAHGNVQILCPMVATLEEIQEANHELASCMKELAEQGVPFNAAIKRGVMIEIPAAVLIADALAKEVDFFSIGTNDLIQYTLAVDRVNETVAQLYQATHPAVLQLIDMTVGAARRNGVGLAVCGETAADPVLAVLYIGMGITELSMSPNLIPLAKHVIGKVSLEEAQALANEMRGMYGETADAIYKHCHARLKAWVPELDELSSL